MTPPAEGLPLAGLALWAAASGLGAVACWALAAALLPARGLADRAQAAIVLGVGLVLALVRALGLAHQLTRPALAAGGLLLFSAALALALELRGRAEAAAPAGRWRAGLASLRAQARADLGAPGRLLREAWALREPAVLALAACAAPVAVSAAMIWFFRSWVWDQVWYHLPITNLAIQEQSLGWVRTSNIHSLGSPKNVELLSVWNVLLPRDNLLDDLAQVPFAALAVAAVAGWTRRLGASRPLAAGLGGAWLLAPPAFLQLHTTHNDLACGAALIVAWAWLTGPRFGRAERWMTAAALALYLGTKYTGAFHLVLLAPLVFARLLHEAVRADGDRPRPLELAALAAAMVLLGGVDYLRNLAAFGNPIFPLQATLPLVGKLPGTVVAANEWSAPFFATPGSVSRLLASWYDARPFYAPDVRTGGFGPLFRWLTFPCVVAVAADALRGREPRRALAVLGLFAVALSVPDPWWSRYAFGACAAALAAFALVHASLPGPRTRLLFSAALVLLAGGGWVIGFPGYITFPRDLPRAWAATPAARVALQIDTFLWPEEAARLREREVGPGDAIAYDGSILFQGELWNRQVTNRAVYAAHALDPETFPPPDASLRAQGEAAADAAYWSELLAARAVWASARAGGHAERVIAAHGGQRLFNLPRSSAVMWRLHRGEPR